ncbi:MAG TPA: protein translocase subunit SecF [Candidatus Babeliaceae bacterium]|nr:protein translocase subunit SecF [Candidatus Babeliaceae bacterium]
MVDFLKYRPLYAFFSFVIFSAFIGGCIYKYQTRGEAFEYSVDFTGGTQVLFEFSQPITSAQVVEVLEKAGWKGAITRDFSPNELLVRVKEFVNDAKGLGERMRSSLEQAFPGVTVTIQQTDSVGSGVGASLRWKSIQAIVVALIIMLLYTWWRFWSFSYGMGVLVSLFHDAIVILAFFLFLNYEISLNVIGAILTILGYSINDTIVIFARIRDNVKKMKDRSIEDIVNISINETLRRTLLTSFATSLVVLALVLFGGEVLRTLALALLVGILFGTYSSIAIASPVMLMFYKDAKSSKKALSY